MLKPLGYILTFIFTIGLVVIVHELGHFLMARYFNIPVRFFSIGFGKVLWRHKFSSTQIQIRLLPVGGFVGLDLSRNFPLWHRSLVTLAGPVISILFGMLVLFISLLIGLELQKPLIGEIIPNSPADLVEMKAEEIVTAINNNEVNHWGESYLFLLRDLNNSGIIKINTLDKSNRQHEYNVKYKLDELAYKRNPLEKLGILPFKAKSISDQKANILIFKFDVYSACIYTLSFTFFLLYMTFLLIYKLLAGILSLQMLTGPIGIAVISTKAFLAGLAFYLYLIAVLSIHFAAINLFIIPGLDGAQLVYDAIEKLRGKMITPAVQELFRNLSIAALIILTGIILSNDIERFLLS